jgi:hypothetical protein
MNAIKNTGFLNLFAITSASGFTPSVGYVYNPSAKTIVVTDNTTYPGGDGLRLVHVHITDSQGGQLYQAITTTGSGGAITFDTSSLNPIEGYTITTTVVSTNGLLGDLSAYSVGSTSPATGNLYYVNQQNG